MTRFGAISRTATVATLLGACVAGCSATSTSSAGATAATAGATAATAGATTATGATPPAGQTTQSSPTTTPTATGTGGGVTSCGQFGDDAELMLVVTGPTSCADATKLMIVYANKGIGQPTAIDVDGWSCVFNDDPTAKVSNSTGIGCSRGNERVQLKPEV